VIVRLRRGRRPAPRVDATIPLMNVVFLLMAFFMLIGRMDATAPFSVHPPRSALGAPLPQGGGTVSVSPTGALALDGAPASLEEILHRLDAEAGTGPDAVRINADATTRLGDLLPLAGALEAAGVPRVVLVVTPPVAGAR
jgi:biopolymer transport protein ExbD